MATIFSAPPADAFLKQGADEARRAAQAKAAHKPQLALQHYDTAIEQNARCLSWRVERARLYMQLHDYKQALQDLDYILKQEPNNSYALQERAHALEWNKEHTRALVACNEALQYNPEDGAMLDLRQEIFKSLGRTKDAAKDAATCLKYGYSKATWDALNAAASANGQKQPLKSVQILQAQIARTPTCPQLYLELCRIEMLNDLKTPPELAALAKEACRLASPGSAFWRQGHSLLAFTYSEQSKQKDALKEYEYALKDIAFRPGKRTVVSGITSDELNYVLYHRAETWATVGEYERAIEDMTNLMNNHVENVEFNKLRAKLYKNAHHPEKALADLKAGAEMEPDDTGLSLNLIETYKELKMWQPAIAVATRLLTINPEDEFLYAERSNFYVKLGKDKLAIVDFTKLIDMGEVKFYRDRAAAYRRLGMTKEADADEKRAPKGN